ncbi:MAG TPA: hypothetical protein PLQ43_12560, partial [Deltaproteobacteria bacterium]|nr:hypothetical protein [Deltaproteobacteria bacterium]
YGLPPISPQNPSRIDRDPLTSDVQELKEWMALMSFLPSLGTSIPEAVYGPGGVVYGRVY